MIPILYESNETEFTSNGLGRLRDIIRCECLEERNGIYEVEFDYPVDGSHFDEILLGRIIAVEHDDTGDVQPFDIYACSRQINGIVTFKAWHISYRQKFLVTSGTDINYIGDAFVMLKNSSPSNPFNYDTDFYKDGYLASADGIPRTVREFLGGVEGSILDTYGGEYEWNKFHVRLWKKRGEDRDITVRYGENMLEFTDDLDYSESYTAVIPYWVKDDIIVKYGIVYSGYSGYDGRVSCVPLDLSDKFEDTPTISQLEEAASSYLGSNDPYLPSRNIKIDFVRILDSDDSYQFSNLQKCSLCDSINVIFPLYGITGKMKIVRVVWDVLQERYIEMELGNLSVSLSEALGLSK